MSRCFCLGKKDFCDGIEDCLSCEFANWEGSVKEDEISLILYKIFGEDYNIDRLKELAEADRDGRCVVLPCKLHDKVFFIENGCVKETEVDSFHSWTSGHWKMSTYTDRMFDHWKGYEIDFAGINKTVFLTREEAEAALERMEGEEK